MQSPLAALSLHAPQSAATGHFGPDERGGGMFAEAFVDVVSLAQADMALHDLSTSEVIPPVACDGTMFASVDLPFPINTGSVHSATWFAAEANCQAASIVGQAVEVVTATPTPDLHQVLIGKAPLVALPVHMHLTDVASLEGEICPEQGVQAGIGEWAEVQQADRAETAAVVDKSSPSSRSTPSPSEPMATAKSSAGPTFITAPDLAVPTDETPMPLSAVRVLGGDTTVNAASVDQISPTAGQSRQTKLPGPLQVDTSVVEGWYGRQVQASAQLGTRRCDIQEPASDGLDLRSPLALPGSPDGNLGTEMKSFDQSVSPRKIEGAVAPAEEPVIASSVLAAFHIDDVRSEQFSVVGGSWQRLYAGPLPSVAPVTTDAGDDPLGVVVPTTETKGGLGDSTGAASGTSPLDLKLRFPPYSNDGTSDVGDARTNAAANGTTESQTGVVIGAAATGWVFSAGESDWFPQGRWLDSSDLHAPAGLANATSGALTASAGIASLPVQQVASQLANVVVRNENDIIELALAPEELGHVRLRMEPDAANPDRMLILINVERPETLELLRRHAGELADAIRNAGYSGADIGFGYSGRDGDAEQGTRSPAYGGDLPVEEVNQFDVTPMPKAGASLDLRL